MKKLSHFSDRHIRLLYDFIFNKIIKLFMRYCPFLLSKIMSSKSGIFYNDVSLSQFGLASLKVALNNHMELVTTQL